MSWKSRAFAKAMRVAFRDTRSRKEKQDMHYVPVSLSSIAAKLSRDAQRASRRDQPKKKRPETVRTSELEELARHSQVVDSLTTELAELRRTISEKSVGKLSDEAANELSLDLRKGTELTQSLTSEVERLWEKTPDELPEELAEMLLQTLEKAAQVLQMAPIHLDELESQLMGELAQLSEDELEEQIREVRRTGQYSESAVEELAEELRQIRRERRS